MGFALAVLGAAGVAVVGWTGVVVSALGAGVTVAMACVDHYADVRDNLSLKSDVAELKMAVHRLEGEARTAKETADSALGGLREVRQQKARPGY